MEIKDYYSKEAKRKRREAFKPLLEKLKIQRTVALMKKDDRTVRTIDAFLSQFKKDNHESISTFYVEVGIFEIKEINQLNDLIIDINKIREERRFSKNKKQIHYNPRLLHFFLSDKKQIKTKAFIRKEKKLVPTTEIINSIYIMNRLLQEHKKDINKYINTNRIINYKLDNHKLYNLYINNKIATIIKEISNNSVRRLYDRKFKNVRRKR